MEIEERWCLTISLTLKALLTDGGEIWKCNVCGGIVHIPVEMVIATPAVWYFHKKPSSSVPQVFRDAFEK